MIEPVRDVEDDDSREKNRRYLNLEHLFNTNNLKSRIWSKFFTGITQIGISNTLCCPLAGWIYLFLSTGYKGKAQCSHFSEAEKETEFSELKD